MLLLSILINFFLNRLFLTGVTAYSFPEEHGEKLMVTISTLSLYFYNYLITHLIYRSVCNYLGTKWLLCLCHPFWSYFTCSVLCSNSQTWPLSF